MLSSTALLFKCFTDCLDLKKIRLYLFPLVRQGFTWLSKRMFPFTLFIMFIGSCSHDARSQRGIWCHRTSASSCFFGNDRSSRSRDQTRLITKCVYYEWASDSFTYPCPCNNSWYARAYPRVKKSCQRKKSRAKEKKSRAKKKKKQSRQKKKVPPKKKKVEPKKDKSRQR